MNIRIVFILIMCAIVTGNVPAGETKQVILQNDFYTVLQKSDPIARLRLLESLKDAVVKGQGSVVRVEKSDILKKKYRIVLLVKLPQLTIYYYCYTDRDDYFDLLQTDDIFEFSGQFIVATPLGTRVDSVICDIILEDGAVIVK